MIKALFAPSILIYVGAGPVVHAVFVPFSFCWSGTLQLHHLDTLTTTASCLLLPLCASPPHTPQGAPVRRLLRMLLQAAADVPATPAAPGPKDGPGPKPGPGPATGLKDGPGPASGPGPKSGPGPAAKPTTPAADKPAEPEADTEPAAAAADEDTPATVATVSEEPAEKNVTEKVVSMDAAATVEELTGPKAMIEVSTKPGFSDSGFRV